MGISRDIFIDISMDIPMDIHEKNLWIWMGNFISTATLEKNRKTMNSVDRPCHFVDGTEA